MRAGAVRLGRAAGPARSETPEGRRIPRRLGRTTLLNHSTRPHSRRPMLSTAGERSSDTAWPNQIEEREHQAQVRTISVLPALAGALQAPFATAEGDRLLVFTKTAGLSPRLHSRGGRGD